MPQINQMWIISDKNPEANTTAVPPPKPDNEPYMLQLYQNPGATPNV